MCSLKIRVHPFREQRILRQTCLISIQGEPLNTRSFLSFQRHQRTATQTELMTACFFIRDPNTDNIVITSSNSRPKELWDHSPNLFSNYVMKEEMVNGFILGTIHAIFRFVHVSLSLAYCGPKATGRHLTLFPAPIFHLYPNFTLLAAYMTPFQNWETLFSYYKKYWSCQCCILSLPSVSTASLHLCRTYLSRTLEGIG